MFGPSGLTAAVEKKDRGDSSGRDTPGTRKKVTVAQLHFYVGIKAVTVIVIIYRICFLQKSRREKGAFLTRKRKLFRLFLTPPYPMVLNIRQRARTLKERDFRFTVHPLSCPFGRTPHPTNLTRVTTNSWGMKCTDIGK